MDRETFFMHSPNDEINEQYLNEAAKYRDAPCAPCSKEKALKLLKKFARKEWSELWHSSVAEYLPAVSQGTMKLEEKLYSHDEAVRHAMDLAASIDEKELARDFLYGVRYNMPEYRSAIACYYYIKNLPTHNMEKRYLGCTIEGKSIYMDDDCEICCYNSKPYDEPKMNFWSVNIELGFFWLLGGKPVHLCLNSSILFLEEYLKLPKPATDVSDRDFFYSLLKDVEGSPENTTPSKLRRLFKADKLSHYSLDQTDMLIDTLGYLNILHKPDNYGVTVKHTLERDQEQPSNVRTDYAYPVCNWKKQHGVDYESVDALFGSAY